MTLPTASNFPNSFDDENNLFTVHDSLRVRLARDYSPGDTIIYIEGDSETIARFPEKGYITLVEQESPIDEKAITFYYNSKTDSSFDEIEILPGFLDTVKPKRITNVIQNVMAEHHNNLKDSLIAIQNFVGVKGTEDIRPNGETLEGRTNYLRKIVFTPKSWFSADQVIGIIPLEVTFSQTSFRLGPNGATFKWNFGDQEPISGISSISTISVIDTVPIDQVNVEVINDGRPITKTYTSPGKFTVTLTVTNEFGEDICVLPEMINARIEAPKEAKVEFDADEGDVRQGDVTPLFSRLSPEPAGPFTTYVPTIRAPINTFLTLTIPNEEMEPGYSCGGEKLEDGNAIDPIINYTWDLGDDIEHPDSRTIKSYFTVGGIYDMILRVDTDFGSYRITQYKKCIDIIEDVNLWLFNFVQGNNVRASEFGLISETFKEADKLITIDTDDSFLDQPAVSDAVKTKMKNEFKRNTGFAKTSNVSSGGQGNVALFWASGGNDYSTMSNQTIRAEIYEGFNDSVLVPSPTYDNYINRPWNWICLPLSGYVYFLFGADPDLTSDSNQSYQFIDRINLTDETVVNTPISINDYLNGANDLVDHPTSGYDSGEPLTGRYATYRTAISGETAYILRNSNAGVFFKLSSFYKTEGTDQPLEQIIKLPSLTEQVKVEGQLIGLSNGIFLFDNTGIISAYNTTNGSWETGGPSNASLPWRSVQDSSVSGFENEENTLLASGDNDSNAYLSFDYSENAFIKFNSIDLTFTNIGPRTSGINTEDQWIMGVY